VNTATLLAELVRIAPSLHKAGTFPAHALEAIARHVPPAVHRSVETGSGASTILLSHLSAHHTVFAVDAGTNSIRAIEASPLLRRETVTFVEGPTQVTLPRHTFTHGLQLALIDGPHGYPFPDLEYYFIYPHLDAGAILIVDDIQIPTITNLFDFLSADDMFELLEVVENTAFFRRTDAPTFPPTGDGWWQQRYNQRGFESVTLELLRESPPTRVEGAALYYLDQFGSVTDPMRASRITIRRDEDVMITGWALDARRQAPAASVDLVLNGVAYRTAVRIPRADVATAHGDRAYFRSGFSARFPPGVLTPGSHELELRIVMTGQHEYVSATQLRFEVI